MPLYNDGQSTPAGLSGGGSGGTPIETDDFQQLSAIGSNVAESRSHADKARTQLQATLGSTDAFGSYPAGQSFASHHDAVATVMSDTMGGIAVDVETFGTNIVTSAKNYRDTDDTASSCLTAIGSVQKVADAAKKDFDSSVQTNKSFLSDVKMDATDAQAGGSSDQTVSMLGGSAVEQGAGPVGSDTASVSQDTTIQ